VSPSSDVVAFVRDFAFRQLDGATPRDQASIYAARAVLASAVLFVLLLGALLLLILGVD
jgi:hypothetical protein